MSLVIHIHQPHFRKKSLCHTWLIKGLEEQLVPVLKSMGPFITQGYVVQLANNGYNYQRK